MPTVTGSITSNGNTFIGKFNISGISHVCNGTFSKSIEKFNAASVTLTYDDTEQLTGTRTFNGTVGPTDLNLTLDNGPKMAGKLDNPISQGYTVDGTVVWTINY